MIKHSAAALGLLILMGGCARETPEALCSGRDARAAIVRMTAERVNRAVWLQPPLNDREAQGMAQISSAELAGQDQASGVITCAATYTVKGEGKQDAHGTLRYTIQKLAGSNGYVYGADDLDPFVQALSAAAGAARHLARPPEKEREPDSQPAMPQYDAPETLIAPEPMPEDPLAPPMPGQPGAAAGPPAKAN